MANCNGLVCLLVEGCKWLTPALLIQFTTAFPRLREFSVADVGDAVTDEVMAAIAHNLPLLEYLDVSWSDRITSVGLMMIADTLRSLHTLIKTGQHPNFR